MPGPQALPLQGWELCAPETPRSALKSSVALVGACALG